MPDLQVLARPIEAVPDEEINICYVVHGRINFDGGAGRLTCPTCGQDTGPWFLATASAVAVAVCKCGQYAVHPGITREAVEKHVDGFEGVWPTLREAIVANGFGRPQ